ncbi:MAG: bifunctional diaminohydroxyphosphoribosylaminopyrimidine deaminase/5-amino-6-(5-phosphoribosylamino)uracil reductase RibD [Pseudomonadota bacterium]
MALAISLGARGLGTVWPNPAVGCVLVKDGRILARGSTGPGGRPHAERIALDRAGPAAKGATAYVSLEPCAHHGKTPPCAAALIEAGVGRVVVAAGDPDPRVAGRGLTMLREAGIAVETGVFEEEAKAVHRGFFTRITAGRPMVTLKLAASFDGRIATATGESQWITGPAARRLVHGERARHDAVLVGGGTARADDPSLTVRGFGLAHQPVRIVASRHLRLGPAESLASVGSPLWLLHGAEPGDLDPADQERWAGARLIPVPVGPGGNLDPGPMLDALGEAGLTRVFCEGGGALAASLLGAGLVDVLIGFTAGLALGAEGRPSLGAMGIERLDETPRFRLVEIRSIGGDVLHRWERTDPPEVKSE